jgi:hypothetical protein
MDFNSLVADILENFKAPIDTKRRTKRTSGKYGSVSPILNDPHDTKAISGFKGQPGGKVKTLKFKLPTKKKQST